MTLKELINIDPDEVFKMDEKSLRHYVAQLNRKARQRISRLKKSETYSYAFDVYKEPKKVRTLNLNQLRAEYKRSKIFLTSKTSTITGAKKSNEQLRKDFGIKGDEVNIDWKQFHNIIGFIKDIAPEVVYKHRKDIIVNEAKPGSWDALPRREKVRILEKYNITEPGRQEWDRKSALYAIYILEQERRELDE